MPTMYAVPPNGLAALCGRTGRLGDAGKRTMATTEPDGPHSLHDKRVVPCAPPEPRDIALLEAAVSHASKCDDRSGMQSGTVWRSEEVRR